jgi:FkbM family methyltransferase
MSFATTEAQGNPIAICNLMVLDTKHLFTTLLPKMQINTICDVGSMNGADSLTFRAAAPEASIYALEPNPQNLQLMNVDQGLKDNRIRILPLAATNYDGTGDFFLVDADYSQTNFWRGLSSLHRRWDPRYPSTSVVQVKTTRLDTFLADKCRPKTRVALWIDAEGMAYEVVEGATGIIEHVYLVHIEVETTPCIGAEQKLYPEVKELLLRLGLIELATDHHRGGEQFNALFVRRDLPAGMNLALKSKLMRLQMRRVLGTVARRLCPACLRRYQSLRLRKAYERTL